MIWEQAIVEWRRNAPWDANSLVEQDLIISRALVEMYCVPEVRERLAFRGGTALYKLHIRDQHAGALQRARTGRDTIQRRGPWVLGSARVTIRVLAKMACSAVTLA